MSQLAKRHRPGSSWRVLVHPFLGKGKMNGFPISYDSESHPGPTEFDELVVDHWLHLEQMSDRDWWLKLGPLSINVTVGEHGEAWSVRVEQEDQAEDGWELVHAPSGSDLYQRTLMPEPRVPREVAP